MTRHHIARLVLFSATVSLASCVTPRPRVEPVRPTSETAIRVGLGNGRVQLVDLEDYVTGSVLAEADLRNLAPAAARRVAEVQAILARTYALANKGRHSHEGFDLCATTHCQVYRAPDDTPAGVRAVVVAATRATTGLVVTHQGRAINAVFHADCGGHTSDATIPWGGPTPSYLRGISDPFCVRDSPAPWQFEVDATQLAAALNEDPRTRVGATLAEIEIAEYDAAGRAVEVVLWGTRTRRVRGEELRAILTTRFGMLTIRSTRLSVARVGARFVFRGSGFGHGVGLCQRGAAARARLGHTPHDILTHYYPGAALTRYH